jgi:hypothetical protein
MPRENYQGLCRSCYHDPAHCDIYQTELQEARKVMDPEELADGLVIEACQSYVPDWDPNLKEEE